MPRWGPNLPHLRPSPWSWSASPGHGWTRCWPGRSYPDTPRARWLDNLFNHLDIRQWEQSGITAQVYDTTGVVTSTYHWAGTMHDHPFDARGYCTDVWRSADAGWQVVSRTCMEFPDAAAEDSDEAT